MKLLLDVAQQHEGVYLLLVITVVLCNTQPGNPQEVMMVSTSPYPGPPAGSLDSSGLAWDCS